MNKKIWGIIIIVMALIIIACIVYVIFFYQFSSAPEQVVEQPAAVVPVATFPPAVESPVKTITTVQPIATFKKTEMRSDDLARMASAFAERFSSFSNQSDYGNVRDLQIFMTDAMKIWAENYITDARAKKTQTTIYYGIVTKVISNEVKQFDSDAGIAEILVKTQRRESAGIAGNSEIFYQDIIIKYVREQGIWRVDGIYWPNK
ncbi:hypothetical protein KKA93_00455 [Patescibacteria group bacterium]|nr:hypothetical protein [Patescibacteria group bacterium]MBU1663266.1 hypothetical protein [Patescibacteria group bacterium]MBU1933860.1 hypothetical protein [Patescibacteria group bacterium]MBU2007996.1 hypothetical protein [Patescibacteria group bacterium]MBU2233559.1 hypothetical protein [Patescibacteria group bacterium]